MTTIAVDKEPLNLEAQEEVTSMGPPPEVSRRVLVVEDCEDTRHSFQQLLELALGIEVDLARDGDQALALLLERPYSIMITDLRMPKLDGMKLIEEIQNRRLPVTVIVTTGHGSIDEAVQAMRMGAYDFLTKPPDPQHLCLLVERALRERTLQDELAALRAQIGDRHAFWNILSKCPRMFDIFELIGTHCGNDDHGPHRRRDWNRQGAGGAGRSSGISKTSAWPVRRGALCCAA